MADDLTAMQSQNIIIPSAGKYLVLFQTTGCAPCQLQVESLNKSAGMERNDEALAIFFEPRAKVAQFKSAFSPEFTCLIDYKAALNDKLKLSAFPQTVELDDGLVIRSWTGLQESFDD